MESKLATESKRSLLAANQRLTPSQRLDAHRVHCRLMFSDSFGNRVDLLVGLRGLDPAAFTRSFDVPFQGESLRVVGREDFIAMKLFAHRSQDLADAESSLIAARESLDMPLLERLARRYGDETPAAHRTTLSSRSSRA